jgi:uncharacterized caspase-like protein
LATLARLSRSAAFQPGNASHVQKLQRAKPEDAVIIYFAGHGVARESRFYLVPYDLGYSGALSGVNLTNVPTLLRHSISDRELERAVEGLDVSYLALIVDACNSGQALEDGERRMGPFNSKGLAQLAYDKGMYILAAAQGTQAALEAAELGHGLLTYSLIVGRLTKTHGCAQRRSGCAIVV